VSGGLKPEDPSVLNFDIHNVLRPHGMDGLFVVLDGFDGTGKTTLSTLIQHHFRSAGREVLMTRSPPRDALDSAQYQKYMYDPSSRSSIDYRGLVAILTGARLQHAHEVILPKLRLGSDVVCDRYVYSAVAHCYSRGLHSERWFRELCSHLPRPDIAVIMDASADVVRQRLSQRPDGHESYIEEAHMRRCLYAYREISTVSGLRLIDTSEGNISPTEAVVQALA
jgi:dTMP kinase